MVTEPIKVRAFEPEDWLLYKHTRMNALKESPDAFVSTYESALTIPDQDWRVRIENVDRENNFPMAAYVDDVIAGMAWVKTEGDTAHLYQMWVSPEFRGLGVGSTLLKSALDWAATRKASVLQLGVTSGDSPATRMYESAGFTPTGDLESLREGSELQVQNMAYKF